MTAPVQTFDGTFTVDVEDYFQVSAFSRVISPDDWDHYECRVENNTRRIMEIAARESTHGTFFILGWVAERFPRLVTEIRAAGHEIGCHSQWHQLVYDLGPQRFRADLIQSRDTLQNLLGEPVRLYRAPSFSITRRSLWALNILVEEGFAADSSIYPTRHDRYGIPGSPRGPHVLQTVFGSIREFPGMTAKFAGQTIPVGGGGYLRLFPWDLTKKLLQQIRSEGRPLNVYLHPWEVDPDQPRIAAPWISRFRHYQNLSTTVPKLTRLLSEFRLTTMSAVLDQNPGTNSGSTAHSTPHSCATITS